ncbi:spermidine synthase [Corynebacterium aquatimens]|uniref:Spermidine synthase n=1 Tax=Corynebacterium aquatimens TaxID=1190508 RepID=A0A931GQZ9_9CORY|nr:fused MFS/spermidine synthase [Corynebacterium aquatimens]MBG6121393.1 spermidine synthase [Corynebacterium aquatimens]WJY66062.1 spermidine synthase [Corynebacterium aquatimens]
MTRKQRAEEAQTYEIDTGTAEIVHEHDGSLLLTVNGVPSSHIVPDEPERLEFEYMRWIVAAAEAFWGGEREKASVTHLGGGGCSLARYFAHAWRGSRNTVVELDGRLAELARAHFDIPRAPAVKIRVGDARAVTDTFHAASRDIIIRDVFAGSTTPRSLSTVDFYTQCFSALRPGGLYLANCGAHSDLKEAREELAGMLEVFPSVAAIADPPMLKGRRYGNIVLIGADHPLDPTPELTRALLGGAVPAHVKGKDWAASLAHGSAARHCRNAPPLLIPEASDT